MLCPQLLACWYWRPPEGAGVPVRSSQGRPSLGELTRPPAAWQDPGGQPFLLQAALPDASPADRSGCQAPDSRCLEVATAQAGGQGWGKGTVSRHAGVMQLGPQLGAAASRTVAPQLGAVNKQPQTAPKLRPCSFGTITTSLQTDPLHHLQPPTPTPAAAATATSSSPPCMGGRGIPLPSSWTDGTTEARPGSSGSGSALDHTEEMRREVSVCGGGPPPPRSGGPEAPPARALPRRSPPG